MNLVNVEKQEAELRATRDANETLLLGVASNSQNESMKWTSQKIEEIIDQDKLVLSKQEFLTKKMNLRQSLNVTKLVNMIETDMKANQDEINSKIPSFLQEYEQKHAHYVQQNEMLKGQVGQVKADYESQKAEEQALKEQHEKMLEDLNIKIDEQNSSAAESAEQLAQI